MIPARNASFVSGAVSAIVLLLSLAIELVADRVDDWAFIASMMPLTLVGLLIAFGLVATSVRLGLRMSRCSSTSMWVAVAIPILTTVILSFIPNPVNALSVFSDELWGMSAVSHPTLLVEAVTTFLVLSVTFSVLLGVSYAFGQLSRRLPMSRDGA